METKFEQKASKGLIVAGYIFSVLGGLIGLLIGYTLWKGTILVDSEKKFKYDESSRKSGMYMVIISVVVILLYFVLN